MGRTIPMVAFHLYLARQSFDSFVAGRQYEYRGSIYQYRDGETIRTFHDRESGHELNWFWFDNKPDSLLLERFEFPGVPPAPGAGVPA